MLGFCTSRGCRGPPSHLASGEVVGCEVEGDSRFGTGMMDFQSVNGSGKAEIPIDARLRDSLTTCSSSLPGVLACFQISLLWRWKTASLSCRSTTMMMEMMLLNGMFGKLIISSHLLKLIIRQLNSPGRRSSEPSQQRPQTTPVDESQH